MENKQELNSNAIYALLGLVFLAILITFGAVTYGDKLRQATIRKIEIQALQKKKLELEIQALNKDIGKN